MASERLGDLCPPVVPAVDYEAEDRALLQTLPPALPWRAWCSPSTIRVRHRPISLWELLERNFEDVGLGLYTNHPVRPGT